jgi:hypothetical protein
LIFDLTDVEVNVSPRLTHLLHTSLCHFRYEISLGRKSGAVICGVDEAGLRSLAEPVVA